MKEPYTYIWDGSQVLIKTQEELFVGDYMHPDYVGMPLVDDYYKGTFRTGKYGEHNVWRHIDPVDFPAEFKTHLLLLGVT